MSAAFTLGCLRKERPESIEKIGFHRYRVQMAKGQGHDNKRQSYIGVGFDWYIAATERPFQHLPFESFLAISVLRWELFRRGDLEPMIEVKGYCPGRINSTCWSVKIADDQRYIGFLMDWKVALTEQVIDNIALQAGLSFYLLQWMCRYKEWRYEAEMMERGRIGVIHGGNRRGSEKLLFEP